jgi:hypothetical protein
VLWYGWWGVCSLRIRFKLRIRFNHPRVSGLALGYTASQISLLILKTR